MLTYCSHIRLLWERLNLDPDARQAGLWNQVDPIFRHPEGLLPLISFFSRFHCFYFICFVGGGIIYVGNQTAAENITYLKSMGITHVVNCTYGI